jgi:hypothetical protein
MTCLRSTDGKMYVCGGFRKKNCHYFTKDYRVVLFCDSLWYGPNLVGKLKRKKFERIDLFKTRAEKKLGFMPLTQRGWWRVIAMPQIRAMEEDRKGRQ